MPFCAALSPSAARTSRLIEAQVGRVAAMRWDGSSLTQPGHPPLKLFDVTMTYSHLGASAPSRTPPSPRRTGRGQARARLALRGPARHCGRCGGGAAGAPEPPRTRGMWTAGVCRGVPGCGAGPCEAAVVAWWRGGRGLLPCLTSMLPWLSGEPLTFSGPTYPIEGVPLASR